MFYNAVAQPGSANPTSQKGLLKYCRYARTANITALVSSAHSSPTSRRRRTQKRSGTFGAGDGGQEGSFSLALPEMYYPAEHEQAAGGNPTSHDENDDESPLPAKRSDEGREEGHDDGDGESESQKGVSAIVEAIDARSV